MTRRIIQFLSFNVLFLIFTLTEAIQPIKEEIDKVIEDEITKKLANDLLQSIEKKYHVDLEKSVDTVLMKIKVLLQNGTSQVQDRLNQMENQIAGMKKSHESEVEACLIEVQNDTVRLAEKGLHQMVLCGYALIGHDPAKALAKVLDMKQKIKDGLKPVNDRKEEIYKLLKVCGHDHDTLKKVVKCVISKSPVVKSSMMDITGRLIEGVVDLTKLMAHGAMHEACLIEVVKTVEDEAFGLLETVKKCAYGNKDHDEELERYMAENNATVLDVKSNKLSNKKEVIEMKALIRRMLSDSDQGIDKKIKKKLMKLDKELGSGKV